ncbi:MAG: hypothetical protein KKE05_02305 [Nanoarchaeota archaeon]|nr:hypothetical protein [Nanoarchaeota archaeon]
MAGTSEDYRKEAETGCCKKIDPKKWEGKTITWKKKRFIKDHVTSFFHIPINFGPVVKRTMAKIDSSKAFPKDPVWISDEKSLWGSDVYFEVTEHVPNAENVFLSGTFMTKVFEGPYQNIKIWMKEMEAYVKSKSKVPKNYYFFYTTCPKCAKQYGKNYVIIFAEI